MKKIITLLITISILFGALGFAAAEEKSKTEINEGFLAAQDYTRYAGQDAYVMPVGNSNPYDKINARTVFVYTDRPGKELTVTIRISETEVVCWWKPLTEYNLKVAMYALEEAAPYCLTEVMVDGEMRHCEYVKDSDESLSFEDYREMSKKLLWGTSNGKVSAEEPSRDPVLSLFPELRWGMTQEETIAEYGQEAFPSSKNNDERTLDTCQTVLGQEEQIGFIYVDGELMGFVLNGKEDIAKIKDQLTETYNTLYGEAERVNYLNTMAGSPSESEPADANYWTFRRTFILMPDSGEIVVYRALY